MLGQRIGLGLLALSAGVLAVAVGPGTRPPEAADRAVAPKRSFGRTGAGLDTTPPTLRVTLSDIDADPRHRLAAPPGGFEITVHYADAGSGVDRASLSITSDGRIGAIAAGAELAGNFDAAPSRAAWRVPSDSDLERRVHTLRARIRDAAGNPSPTVRFRFAVRDFAASGPPLGSLQTVFVDFDQDRGGSASADFLEDLRHYGLATAGDPVVEAAMRDSLVAEIVRRANAAVGRDADGGPREGALNVVFTADDPSDTAHTRLCVGGESPWGPLFLGSAVFDPGNARGPQDDCAAGPVYGIFPRAIEALWGDDPSYRAAFAPLAPGAGGVPVGADPRDAALTAPGFDPRDTTAAALPRWRHITEAAQAFAQLIATLVVHETFHTLGLVAHGDPPTGLYGGSDGADTDHNVTRAGRPPAESFLMNAGASFRFDALTGRNGSPLPRLRAINRAYLENRIVVGAAASERVADAGRGTGTGLRTP